MLRNINTLLIQTHDMERCGVEQSLKRASEFMRIEIQNNETLSKMWHEGGLWVSSIVAGWVKYYKKRLLGHVMRVKNG